MPVSVFAMLDSVIGRPFTAVDGKSSARLFQQSGGRIGIMADLPPRRNSGSHHPNGVCPAGGLLQGPAGGTKPARAPARLARPAREDGRAQTMSIALPSGLPTKLTLAGNECRRGGLCRRSDGRTELVLPGSAPRSPDPPAMSGFLLAASQPFKLSKDRLPEPRDGDHPL